LFADDLSKPLQFERHLLIGGRDVVEGVRNLASETHP